MTDQRWSKIPLWARREREGMQDYIAELERQLAREKQEPLATTAEGALGALERLLGSWGPNTASDQDTLLHQIGIGIISALLHQSKVTEALTDRLAEGQEAIESHLEKIADQVERIGDEGGVVDTELSSSLDAVAAAVDGLARSIDFPLNKPA